MEMIMLYRAHNGGYSKLVVCIVLIIGIVIGATSCYIFSNTSEYVPQYHSENDILTYKLIFNSTNDVGINLHTSLGAYGHFAVCDLPKEFLWSSNLDEDFSAYWKEEVYEQGGFYVKTSQELYFSIGSIAANDNLANVTLVQNFAYIYLIQGWTNSSSGDFYSVREIDTISTTEVIPAGIEYFMDKSQPSELTITEDNVSRMVTVKQYPTFDAISGVGATIQWWLRNYTVVEEQNPYYSAIVWGDMILVYEGHPMSEIYNDYFDITLFCDYLG
jgi:hypothetical protein